MKTQKHPSLHAIVVLPAGRRGAIRDKSLRRWLSKGRLSVAPPSAEMLHRVTALTGHDTGDAGLAALHFWGQTGERSGAWMAAADPVHLEARLDHLYLHDLRGQQMPMSDLRSVFDYLQATFGSDDLAFARIGRQGYLRGKQAIATADRSARALDGRRPDALMPKQGRDANGYHRLVSEIQMALHEHGVNQDRLERGLREINSLWIWGGGLAPELSAEPIFPLFSGDPLFKGFWFSRTGIVEPWSDSFNACIELAEKGFVAMPPGSTSVDAYLAGLRPLLAKGSIGRLTLLFRDGLHAELHARDAYRFWRRESPLLGPQ